MAQSPAHRFGQIMGDVLEAAIEPVLEEFADQHGLFLDRKGYRPTRQGKKLSWKDVFGNTHDLDFVLERGGSASRVGTPVAFIETAWRSYTKHSRNKAQEIQGAIQPLLLTHSDAAPFAGVVLAGVFTQGALTQLASLNFQVLYFPYTTVIEAFGVAGINASFDESTSDADLAQKIAAWNALTPAHQSMVRQTLITVNVERVQRFIGALTHSVTRHVATVKVLPLHGATQTLISIQEAIAFIESYKETADSDPFVRYEIEVFYNNGDKIEARFAEKSDALSFLSRYLPPALELVNRTR